VKLERLSAEEAKRRAVDRYSDPAWIARQPHPDAFKEERFLKLRAAEAPLAAELQELGYAVDSAWEMYLYGEYDDAIPVLVRHLHEPYPDWVRRGIATALNTRASSTYWSQFVSLYEATEGSEAKNGLAIILSTLVTRATLAEYMKLVLDEENGDSRILMIRALKRLRDPRGRELLEKLQAHPSLGVEARATVSGRSRSR
jgi:hypothetical protein